MISKEFKIDELNLNYYVGISQIKLDLLKILTINKLKNEEETIDFIFKIIETIENKFSKSTIQILNDKYILNQEHVFMACYYAQKVFQEQTNVSKKKKVEILLFLSANRQISKAIETFGVHKIELNESSIILCIISPINNLHEMLNEVLQNLHAIEVNLIINEQSIQKILNVKDFFEISDKQINTVLKSYGIHIDQKKDNLNYLYLTIQDLLCEKMTLLNLGIVKGD